MKRLELLASELAYGDPVRIVAEKMNVGLTEARVIISEMTFLEYRNMFETVVPPSGQTITPTGSSGTGSSQDAAPTAAAKATWSGKGPVNVGMTVGLKGADGLPVPGEVSQVDMGAHGVKVKNPTTNQDEWMNIQDLQPFMAASDAGQDMSTQPTAEDMTGLSRLRELAGIKENCSGGSTGAGAIAIAPAAMGSVKKRQPTDEEMKTEYTPKHAAKTIAGDTKPNQATGKLSADLAASGKLAAGRANNGKKRR